MLMKMKSVLIFLVIFMFCYGSYSLVASTKEAVIQALQESNKIDRQERIKEMAEAILLADKMRGE